MNLTQSYWNLTRIAEQLLDHCQRHEIVIWPEFATLVGFVKNSGIMPSSSDGAFGLFSEAQRKLVDTWNSENYLDFEIEMDTHTAGSWVVKIKDNDEDTIDLFFYKHDADSIRSVDGFHKHLQQHLLPLSKATFLGHVVHLPADPDAIIEHQCAWLKSTSASSSPVRSVDRRTVGSVEQLIQLVDSKPTIPFIVNQTAILQCSDSQFQELISKQKQLVYGYSSSTTWEWNDLSAQKVYENWLNRNLAINIVDSPLDAKDDILSHEWQSYVKKKLGDQYDLSLCWVFTNAPKVTHWHTDPKFAGGFMRLLKGEKIWWMVAPGDLEYLETQGHTVQSLSKMNINEMLQLENNYLFGKLYVDTISGGDLLWFPINTLHKVLTVRDSLGFGGYI